MLLNLIMMALAIDNLTGMIAKLGCLAGCMKWTENSLPYVGKMLACKYWQMLGFAVLVAFYAPPMWVVGCLALHKMAQLSGKYLGCCKE